jgi:hypothetical protein
MYVRWSGHGDNAIPDPAICEFVRDWNARYTWPHFVICGTSEAFRAFEQRYGDRLPLVRGDWTLGGRPSSVETAMNRAGPTGRPGGNGAMRPPPPRAA